MNDQNSIKTQTIKLNTKNVLVDKEKQSKKIKNIKLETNNTSVNKVELNQVADEFEIKLNQKSSKAEPSLDRYTASLLKIVVVLFIFYCF